MSTYGYCPVCVEKNLVFVYLFETSMYINLLMYGFRAFF